TNEDESTSPNPLPKAERDWFGTFWQASLPGEKAARASWANSLKRVSSPAWEDQTARSPPQVIRPWAVSQSRRALGCLANSSRPTSPPYTAMAWRVGGEGNDARTVVEFDDAD